MKTKNKMIRFFIANLALFASTIVWPQQEMVNGYFDTENNWFVFKWVNPQTGQQQGIYDSSNKIKPLIHAIASFDSLGGTYTYSYQVTNGAGAIQLLQYIFVQHLSAVSGGTTPSGEWGGAEYRNSGNWAWDKTLGEVRGIPAGQTVNGFAFKSKGLPTIVRAGFTGRRREVFNSPSDDDDTVEVNASFERVYQKLKSQYPSKFVDTVQQKTVGPTDPPAIFDAASFIQNLLSLEQQAVALGWIKNQGIARSLEAKLSHAKNEIVDCRINTATNTVNAFLDEVRDANQDDKDKKSENHEKLTSEGYALMYFNAKYLLTQLENKTNLNCQQSRDRDDSNGDHKIKDEKK